MDKKLHDLLAAMPKGLYAHPIGNFINGTISTTKRGTVKIPLEIAIAQLGSPFDDLRAVLSPSDNKLIPLLLFVDAEEVAQHVISKEPAK
jgi:hypothetical protein